MNVLNSEKGKKSDYQHVKKNLGSLETITLRSVVGLRGLSHLKLPLTRWQLGFACQRCHYHSMHLLLFKVLETQLAEGLK